MMAVRALKLHSIIKKHLPEEVILENKIKQEEGPGKMLTFYVLGFSDSPAGLD